MIQISKHAEASRQLTGMRGGALSPIDSIGDLSMVYYLLSWILIFLSGCGTEEKTVSAVTSDLDFTLTLFTPNRFLEVGDEAPIVTTLRRTDGSNIPVGTTGEIVLHTTFGGSLAPKQITVDILESNKREFTSNVTFIAVSPRTRGRVEVTASFLDAVTEPLNFFVSLPSFAEE